MNTMLGQTQDFSEDGSQPAGSISSGGLSSGKRKVLYHLSLRMAGKPPVFANK
jgi:hypothetical protein